MALNSQRNSCFCFLSAGIKGVHHTWYTAQKCSHVKWILNAYKKTPRKQVKSLVMFLKPMVLVQEWLLYSPQAWRRGGSLLLVTRSSCLGFGPTPLWEAMLRPCAACLPGPRDYTLYSWDLSQLSGWKLSEANA